MNMGGAVDCHAHWGPSVSLQITVTTQDILKQADEALAEKVVVFPFPSEAIRNAEVNRVLLDESVRVREFIPFYYVLDDLKAPRDERYRGVKWHWVRGVQDSTSNPSFLSDPSLEPFLNSIREMDIPILIEEDLEATCEFVKKAEGANIIIPHLGMLGGSPYDFLQRLAKFENVHFDSSLASTQTLTDFIKEIGASRVLFGSDIPFGRMGNELQKVLTLDIGRKEREAIIRENILKLTGFP